MSVQLTYDFVMQALETIEASQDHFSDPQVTHAISGTQAQLTSSTTPPVTKAWSDERQLVAGTDTIDLTALDRGDELADVDFTALRVQAVKIKADPANTDTITVAPGASNGYNLFGAASGQVTLAAGDVVMLVFQNSLDDVAAGDAEIDVTSSDADAKYDVLLVAG